MEGQARVLFHSPSRRGMGHVMRSSNLARAVHTLDPRAEVLVQVSNGAVGQVLGTTVPWVDADHTAPGRWLALLESFRPTLVVFDTLLPGAWAVDEVPRALVWRNCVAERHEAMVADPRLEQMRVIIVPHARDDVDYQLPEATERRTAYVGPIVRTSTAEGRARVRSRFGIRPGDFVVTSTLGGGGFDESAAWLLETVRAAHGEMARSVLRLRHVLVRGPMAEGGEVDPLPGLTQVDVEPDLVDLFALSDMVVGEAGYNTVTEIRQVGVPALFVPGTRTFDDQTERAEAMAALGLARVVGRSSRELAVQAMLQLALASDTRAAMRARARRHPLERGNERAAAAILAAAR